MNIEFDHDQILNVKVIVRPHTFEILDYLSERFELGVFTAGD